MQAPPRWLLDVYARFRDDVKMLVATQDHVEMAYNLRQLQSYSPKEVIAGVAEWGEAGLLEIIDDPIEGREHDSNTSICGCRSGFLKWEMGESQSMGASVLETTPARRSL